MELPLIIMLVLIGFLALITIIVFLFLKRQDKKETAEAIKHISDLDIELQDASQKAAKAPEIESETEKPEIEPEIELEEKQEEPETVEVQEEPETVEVEQKGEIKEPKEEMPLVLEKTKPGLAVPEESPTSSDDGSAFVIDIDNQCQESPHEPQKQNYGAIFSEEVAAEQEKPPIEPEMIFETGITGDVLEGAGAMNIEEPEEKASPEDIFQDTTIDPEPPQIDTEKTDEPVDVFSEKPQSASDIFSTPTPVAAPEVPSEQDIESLLSSAGPEFTEVSEEVEPAAVQPSAPPVPPIKPVIEEMDTEDQKRHEKAKRIARVIINDIRNYNPDKLAEGIRQRNILKTLGVEIERGRQLYIKRVPPDIAKITNYYREALIKNLADGRLEMFGWK